MKPALKHAALMLCLAVTMTTSSIAQDTLQPSPGPEITNDVVDIQSNTRGTCLLYNSGSLFCFDDHFPNDGFGTDFAALNDTLDNDIKQFTLSDEYLRAIGNTRGIACVEGPGVLDDLDNPNHVLSNLSEPDATYTSISSLGKSYGVAFCAIQADNRLVCESPDSIGTTTPEEALYLKQYSSFRSTYCGVDLNDLGVCWGNRSGGNFSDDALAALGTLKQIEVGTSADCALLSDGTLTCVGSMEAYSDQLEGRKFQSIALHNIGGTSLCYTDMDNQSNCLTNERILVDGIFVPATILPEGYTPKLIWASREGYGYTQLNEDGSLLQFNARSFNTPRKIFPSAPTNLRREIYSSNSLELFWDRAETYSYLATDYVTGYEIYRDGELIAVTGHANSYYDSGIPAAGTHQYTVVPLRLSLAGYPSSVDAIDTPIDEPSNPDDQATTPSPTGLSFAVYSSKSAEIFWDRSDQASTSYDIFRNGVLISEGQYGISLWQPALNSNISYEYSVVAMVDGIASSPVAITLETSPSSEEPVVDTDVPAPTGLAIVRYSRNSVELFWDRVTNANGATLYEVTRNDVSLRTQDGISYYDNAASRDSDWIYKVVAIDENGNRSAQVLISAPQ